MLLMYIISGKNLSKKMVYPKGIVPTTLIWNVSLNLNEYENSVANITLKLFEKKTVRNI